MDVPDTLKCTDPGARNVRVFLDGKERFNVVEYSMSEGWIKVNIRDARGHYKTERGKYVTITKRGSVEVIWKITDD